MKKFRISIALVALLIVVAMPVSAGTRPESEVTPSAVVASEKAQHLTKRLEEINAMNKADMTRSEKRQLHRDVRAINKELRETGGGVYLSVGAVIIILLLLIILL